MAKKPGYYAIIPADVRYDNDLKGNEKLLYGEITALANKRGYCWAKNSYFAKLYDVNSRTIQRYINTLEKKKYIITQSNSSGRVIVINPTTGVTKLSEGGDKIVTGGDSETPSDSKDKSLKNRPNITSINNTSNNKPKEKEKYTKKKKKFSEEVYDLWEIYLTVFEGVYNPRTFPDKRKRRIKARLKIYDFEEIKNALVNIRNSDYMCGDNDAGRVYATPEYCFRNDEIIERWLNKNIKDKQSKDKDLDQLKELWSELDKEE